MKNLNFGMIVQVHIQLLSNVIHYSEQNFCLIVIARSAATCPFVDGASFLQCFFTHIGFPRWSPQWIAGTDPGSSVDIYPQCSRLYRKERAPVKCTTEPRVFAGFPASRTNGLYPNRRVLDLEHSSPSPRCFLFCKPNS